MGDPNKQKKQLYAAALRLVPIIVYATFKYIYIYVHVTKWSRTGCTETSPSHFRIRPENYSGLPHHFCTLYVSYQNWMVVKAYNLTSWTLYMCYVCKCVSGSFLSPLVPPGQSPLVLAPGVWLKGPKHPHTAAYVGQYQHGFQQLQEKKNLHCVKLRHMHLHIYNASGSVCVPPVLCRGPGWRTSRDGAVLGDRPPVAKVENTHMQLL